MTGAPHPEIVVAEIERNAREVIRVALTDFNGAPMLSIRVWFAAPGGLSRPGKAGINIHARHLPALADALARALATARADDRLPPG